MNIKNILQGNKYKSIALTVLMLIIAVKLFAQPYRVYGDCMEPAIKSGKLYFLNKASPSLHKYQIGDIIVFKHEGKNWISRVVALENDTIQITENNVIVNNTALDNTAIHRNWLNWQHGEYAINEPFKIPKDHVFALSDNLSAQHDDSRVFGPILNSDVLGHIW